MLHFHQFTCLLFAGIFGTALCCQIPQWERISQHAVPPQPALSAAATARQTATAAVTAQSQSVTSAVSTTAAPAVETTAPAQTTALTTTAPIPHTELVCTAEMVQAAACESSAEIPSEPTVTETVPAATETAAAALKLQPIEAQTLLGAQETWFKAYMDYRTITDTASRQYQLQQSAWTDDQGLRRLGEDYLVAMGTGWLNEGCGERFQVTLDSGAQFTVTVGDVKADCHTDSTRRYRACGSGANVLEFIVDTPMLSAEAQQAGTVSVYAELAGNIAEIARIPESD